MNLYNFKVVDYYISNQTYVFRVIDSVDEDKYRFIYIPINKFPALMMMQHMLAKGDEGFNADMFDYISGAVLDDLGDSSELLLISDGLTSKDIYSNKFGAYQRDLNYNAYLTKVDSSKDEVGRESVNLITGSMKSTHRLITEVTLNSLDTSKLGSVEYLIDSIRDVESLGEVNWLEMFEIEGENRVSLNKGIEFLVDNDRGTQLIEGITVNVEGTRLANLLDSSLVWGEQDRLTSKVNGVDAFNERYINLTEIGSSLIDNTRLTDITTVTNMVTLNEWAGSISKLKLVRNEIKAHGFKGLNMELDIDRAGIKSNIENMELDIDRLGIDVGVESMELDVDRLAIKVSLRGAELIKDRNVTELNIISGIIIKDRYGTETNILGFDNEALSNLITLKNIDVDKNVVLIKMEGLERLKEYQSSKLEGIIGDYERSIELEYSTLSDTSVNRVGVVTETILGDSSGNRRGYEVTIEIGDTLINRVGESVTTSFGDTGTNREGQTLKMINSSSEKGEIHLEFNIYGDNFQYRHSINFPRLEVSTEGSERGTYLEYVSEGDKYFIENSTIIKDLKLTRDYDDKIIEFKPFYEGDIETDSYLNTTRILDIETDVEMRYVIFSGEENYRESVIENNIYFEREVTGIGSLIDVDFGARFYEESIELHILDVGTTEIESDLISAYLEGEGGTDRVSHGIYYLDVVFDSDIRQSELVTWDTVGSKEWGQESDLVGRPLTGIGGEERYVYVSTTIQMFKPRKQLTKSFLDEAGRDKKDLEINYIGEAIKNLKRDLDKKWNIFKSVREVELQLDKSKEITTSFREVNRYEIDGSEIIQSSIREIDLKIDPESTQGTSLRVQSGGLEKEIESSMDKEHEMDIEEVSNPDRDHDVDIIKTKLFDKTKTTIMNKDYLGKGLLYDYSNIVEDPMEVEDWDEGYAIPDEYDPDDPFNPYYPWAEEVGDLELVQKHEWDDIKGEWDKDKENIAIKTSGDSISLSEFEGKDFKFSFAAIVGKLPDCRVGFVFNYKDSDNYYKFTMSSGSTPFLLEQIIGGESRTVAMAIENYFLDPGSKHKVDIVFIDNKLQIFTDGRIQYDLLLEGI